MSVGEQMRSAHDFLEAEAAFWRSLPVHLATIIVLLVALLIHVLSPV